MYAAPGIGLAATQVGEPQRIIVLDVHDKDEGPGKHLLKLVNPVIAEREGEIIFEEGCLSVPDFTRRGEARRSASCCKAWTPEEKEIAIEADGLLAVALQHELDHLDGKLFIDRLSRLKRDLYRARQRKLERQGRPRVERTHAARHLSASMPRAGASCSWGRRRSRARPSRRCSRGRDRRRRRRLPARPAARPRARARRRRR